MEELIVVIVGSIVELLFVELLKILGFLLVGVLCLPVAIFVAVRRPGQYLQNVFELAVDMSRKFPRVGMALK